MRILQLLPNLDLGGVERGTVDLAKSLVKDGHHSVIISNGGALLKELEGTNIKHYSLPVHRKSFLSIFSLINPVRQIIKDEEIDLVHARSRVPAWIGYWAAKKENIPFITTAHGFYRRHWGSRVMGFGKQVIVVSSPLKKYMKQNFRIPENRLRLIHRGINFEKIKDDQLTRDIDKLGRESLGHFGIIDRMIRSLGAETVWLPSTLPRLVGVTSALERQLEKEKTARDLYTEARKIAITNKTTVKVGGVFNLFRTKDISAEDIISFEQVIRNLDKLILDEIRHIKIAEDSIATHKALMGK